MAQKISFFIVAFLLLAPCAGFSDDRPHFSFGFGGGAYRPKEYTRETVVRNHFGSWGTPEGRIEAGWVIHRLASLEASVGYIEAEKTYFETSERYPDILPAEGKYTLTVLPIDLSLIFRADFFTDQVVIPYLGLGMDELYFNQEGKDRIWGWKWGSHALGGLRIFLNPLDPRHTGNLKAEYGIDGVYLDFQAKYAVIYRHQRSTPTGFDFSGWFFTASFLFEF